MSVARSGHGDTGSLSPDEVSSGSLVPEQIGMTSRALACDSIARKPRAEAPPYGPPLPVVLPRRPSGFHAKAQ
eukprot:8255940-Pyramimonas_sp.AAC.1